MVPYTEGHPLPNLFGFIPVESEVFWFEIFYIKIDIFLFFKTLPEVSFLVPFFTTDRSFGHNEVGL